jgi:hypothetical protein
MVLTITIKSLTFTNPVLTGSIQSPIFTEPACSWPEMAPTRKKEALSGSFFPTSP